MKIGIQTQPAMRPYIPQDSAPQERKTLPGVAPQAPTTTVVRSLLRPSTLLLIIGF